MSKLYKIVESEETVISYNVKPFNKRVSRYTVLTAYGSRIPPVNYIFEPLYKFEEQFQSLDEAIAHVTKLQSEDEE